MQISPAILRSSLGLLSALLVVSCAGPRVKVLDRPVTATKTSRALTNATALELRNRETLRREGLLKLYKRDASAAIDSLYSRYRSEPTEERRKALAEMASDRADRLSGDQPLAALGSYLDSASLTEKATLASLGEGTESRDRTLYNYCAARVTRLIKDHGEGASSVGKAPGNLKDWSFSVATGKDMVDPREFDLVVPASWLKSSGLKWKSITQDGFGAAMVGHQRFTPERKKEDPLIPPGGRGFPLNASFRFSGSSADLVLQDLMDDSDGTISGHQVPLAADFSSAVSFSYYEKGKGMNKLAALLRPGEFEGMTGMYSLQPFDEDRIPLVLVHGLLSTAEGWLPFVNLLLADPVVREKYQLILFNYPTGNPISRNAADLRDALAEFQKNHDPNRRNPKMRRMVILGHSMGGIISNMQIRDSGDRFYKSVFTTGLDELAITDEERAEVQRLAFFEANPDIDRALLLAAPLRGSAFATNQIGRFGAWLIRLPFNMVDSIFGNIEVIDVLTDAAQDLSQRPHNSVTSLRPDNPALELALESPVRKGVPIHSIIAQRDPDVPTIEGSDGVVPYTSAHLDEAVSEEIILDADHRSMVHKEETINEVLRILYLHAGMKWNR